MPAIISNLKTGLKTEFTRKSIHILIAASPAMAAWNRSFTVVFLMAGILAYIYLESLRIKGIHIPVFSNIAAKAGRSRDAGRFVLGPVTLGMGALIALVFFPPMTAAIAIYALAFGDGFASLIGRPFGRTKPAFLNGKSLEGSLACFAAVFTASWGVSRSLPISLAASVTAVLTEALPVEDFDNILIPLAVALSVSAIIH